jgi:hypothetical protein
VAQVLKSLALNAVTTCVCTERKVIQTATTTDVVTVTTRERLAADGRDRNSEFGEDSRRVAIDQPEDVPISAVSANSHPKQSPGAPSVLASVSTPRSACPGITESGTSHTGSRTEQ